MLFQDQLTNAIARNIGGHRETYAKHHFTHTISSTLPVGYHALDLRTETDIMIGVLAEHTIWRASQVWHGALLVLGSWVAVLS